MAHTPCCWCKSWIPIKADKPTWLGECRRFPPSIPSGRVPIGEHHLFPLTHAHQWCDEWTEGLKTKIVGFVGLSAATRSALAANSTVKTIMDLQQCGSAEAKMIPAIGPKRIEEIRHAFATIGVVWP